MTNLTYTFLNKDTDLINLTRQWEEKGIQSVAMDFEEESNLHVYGEHLCLIQLFDRENYYIVDALALSPETLKLFLENEMEKIMFACASDAAIARKILNIQLSDNQKACFVDSHLHNIFKYNTAASPIRAQYAIYNFLKNKNLEKIKIRNP